MTEPGLPIDLRTLFAGMQGVAEQTATRVALGKVVSALQLELTDVEVQMREAEVAAAEAEVARWTAEALRPDMTDEYERYVKAMAAVAAKRLHAALQMQELQQKIAALRTREAELSLAEDPKLPQMLADSFGAFQGADVTDGLQRMLEQGDNPDPESGDPPSDTPTA